MQNHNSEMHVNSRAQVLRANLLTQFSGLNFQSGLVRSQPEKLASCVETIDAFLEGGIPFGSITEFGMPLGREGRALILKFLANATQGKQTKPLWTLWASSHEDFQVFPPAWFAKGVSASRIVFTHSQKPLRDLKRAIMHPLFKVIILDSPQKFTKDDCSFISRQARANRQLVVLLRNFFLSNRQGNIWAKLRINCWKRHNTREFVLKVIHGLSHRQLTIREEILT